MEELRPGLWTWTAAHPSWTPEQGGRTIVLTCFWHRRSTSELVEALDATVHAPAVDLGELGLPAKPYAVGDDLAGDVEPHLGAYPNECTLWIRGHSAL